MTIPEISESQVALMKEVTYDPNLSIFSQCSNLPTDPLSKAFEMALAAADAAHLVSLGFLHNITADHEEQVKKTNETSGRMWTVFEITALGRAMFGVTTSAAVN